MAKEILINSTPQETRIALVENKKVAEFFLSEIQTKESSEISIRERSFGFFPECRPPSWTLGTNALLFSMPETSINRNTMSKSSISTRKRVLTPPSTKSVDVAGKKSPPIAELVREGQEILVQVAKGPIGTKGARLTCHISLPGRNVVFMPTLKHNGVSRKIESYDLRKKLKKIIDNHRTREGGFIVRTAASSGQADRQLNRMWIIF